MASKQNADKPQRKRTQRFNHPFPSVTRGHREHRANLTCFKDQLIARNFSGVSSVLSVSSSAAGGKKNHVWGSSCHQYLPIRLIHKSEGREHGQESPALMCDVCRTCLSKRARYGATEDSTRPLLRKEPRPTPAYVPTIRLTHAN